MPHSLCPTLRCTGPPIGQTSRSRRPGAAALRSSKRGVAGWLSCHRCADCWARCHVWAGSFSLTAPAQAHLTIVPGGRCRCRTPHPRLRCVCCTAGRRRGQFTPLARCGGCHTALAAHRICPSHWHRVTGTRGHIPRTSLQWRSGGTAGWWPPGRCMPHHPRRWARCLPHKWRWARHSLCCSGPAAQGGGQNGVSGSMSGEHRAPGAQTLGGGGGGGGGLGGGTVRTSNAHWGST